MKKLNLLLSIGLLFAFIVAVIISCKKKSDDSPPTPTEPVAYTSASAANGGQLYDKFWSVETGFNQSDANMAKFIAKSDFFRCKQCHAWDLLGQNGSYGNRGANANRPHVAALGLYAYAQSKTPQELFDGIKKSSGRRDIAADLSTWDANTNYTEGDKMPNYSQILTDAQIWDLVKFLKTGAIDVSKLYDATYTGTYPTRTTVYANIGTTGVAADGNTYYSSNCLGCHGSDGKLIADLDGTVGMTAGKFLRNKPNELQHKIKFGQLVSSMSSGFPEITLSQIQNLYKALTDTLIYSN